MQSQIPQVFAGGADGVIFCAFLFPIGVADCATNVYFGSGCKCVYVNTVICMIQ